MDAKVGGNGNGFDNGVSRLPFHPDITIARRTISGIEGLWQEDLTPQDFRQAIGMVYHAIGDFHMGNIKGMNSYCNQAIAAANMLTVKAVTKKIDSNNEFICKEKRESFAREIAELTKDLKCEYDSSNFGKRCRALRENVMTVINTGKERVKLLDKKIEEVEKLLGEYLERIGKCQDENLRRTMNLVHYNAMADLKARNFDGVNNKMATIKTLIDMQTEVIAA